MPRGRRAVRKDREERAAEGMVCKGDEKKGSAAITREQYRRMTDEELLARGFKIIPAFAPRSPPPSSDDEDDDEDDENF